MQDTEYQITHCKHDPTFREIIAQTLQTSMTHLYIRTQLRIKQNKAETPHKSDGNSQIKHKPQKSTIEKHVNRR